MTRASHRITSIKRPPPSFKRTPPPPFSKFTLFELLDEDIVEVQEILMMVQLNEIFEKYE